MVDRTELSVIVPTLNRAQDLLEFVHTLTRQTVLPGELLVVDAGAESDLDARVREALAGSGIELVYLRSEPSTSRQRNLAIDRAKGEILFFFDDDILLEPDYIERTLECFDRPASPPVGGVQGTFTSPMTLKGPEHAWARIFGLTHIIVDGEARVSRAGGIRWLGKPSEIRRVPVLSGGRTAYRRECFEHERFAEFLPGYAMGEDVELAWRVGQRWTLLQTPHARCYHKRAQGGRVDEGERAGRIIYSQFYFFRQHMPHDPLHLASFLWANAGITALYMGRALLRLPPGQRLSLIRGVARGYRRCLADVLSS